MASIPQLLEAANKALPFYGDVKIAVAIALAESGGNETQVSGTNSDGSIDVGAWKINSIHKRDHPNWTTEWLKNLNNNAKAMSTLSLGGVNWMPWEAFKNGKYKDHLQRVQDVLDQGANAVDNIGGSVLGTADNAVDAVGNVIDTVTNFGEWFTDPQNLQRLAQIVGGIGLGLVAVLIIGGALYERVK